MTSCVLLLNFRVRRNELMAGRPCKQVGKLTHPLYKNRYMGRCCENGSIRICFCWRSTYRTSSSLWDLHSMAYPHARAIIWWYRGRSGDKVTSPNSYQQTCSCSMDSRSLQTDILISALQRIIGDNYSSDHSWGQDRFSEQDRISLSMIVCLYAVS